MDEPSQNKKGIVKDSAVALVRVGYDGKVHKWYRGPLAKERFLNERNALRYLEGRGCDFVPTVLAEDETELYLVTSNRGSRAESISAGKARELFDTLETYGVRHHDQAARNITYDSKKGCFCIIDFEFSTNLETGEGLTLEEAEAEHERWKKRRSEE